MKIDFVSLGVSKEAAFAFIHSPKKEHFRLLSIPKLDLRQTLIFQYK
jgi:hypothetical protein